MPFNSEVARSAAQAMRLCQRLLAAYPTRPPGSEASRGAADALAADARLFTQAVYQQDFTVHPRAFLAWIRLLIGLYALGLAALWLGWALAAALLATLGVAVMVGQFFFYAEVLDRFFPAHTGRNVWAVVEPRGEVRGQLIVTGHHDSARITNFLAHNPQWYDLRVNSALGTYLLFLVLAWAEVFAGGAGWTFWANVLLTVQLGLMAQLWFFAADEYTPGAGDNLASTAAAWEAVRLLAGQGELKHLRVVAASWDAEEAGLRGARAWVTAHRSELTLPTWNLNFECLYDQRELFLMHTDVNGTVKLERELSLTCQALLQAQGVAADVRPIPPLAGGTDAGEFGRVGIPATTLFGMRFGTGRSTAYHTPADTLDKVSEEAVGSAIGLTLELARKLDGELGQR